MISEEWKQYKANPTQEMRNRLLLQFIPYVETIAKQVEKLVPLSFDELKSAGVQSLFKLIDKYDPEQGIPFEGFAYLRIRGAMIDESRSYHPMKKDQILFNKAHNVYSSQSRFVSLEGITESGGSLDFLVDHTVKSGEDYYIQMENDIELHQVLSKLSERERIILSLYFNEEKRFNEIAEILDLSPSYISKIYQSCIHKLRLHMSRMRALQNKK